MYLSRVQITNFRNFKSLDVALQGDMVMVGENRVGKSNFILALRLVLDASLSDAARQLKVSDIWDGCDRTVDHQVEVHLDFREFGSDDALLALLTDYRVPEDHETARLSYVLRKKADVEGPPASDADYEFKVFGGGDETRALRSDVRRRVSLDLLPALRDAEGELGNWRSSPLRPLLEDAIAEVPEGELKPVADDLAAATDKLRELEPVKVLEAQLRDEISALAGESQDMKAKLGFAPSDPVRVFRSIGLFIDDGKRGIGDASLGSANLALLALRLAEFQWRQTKNERNYTFLCIEEPEAHLHPHLQRQIFRQLFADDGEATRGLLVTTHSPHIASVAPLKSIVVIRSSTDGARGYSLAGLNLTASEFEDLQRYVNSTRAEVLFSRGVIFVEGDAEAALLPVFANGLGLDLDEMGVAVCNVAGTHFAPYVKLAAALGMPHAVITDWDPLDGSKPALGRQRAIDIANARRAVTGREPIGGPLLAKLVADDDTAFRAAFAGAGIFMNASTLEVEVSSSAALKGPLLDVLETGSFGPRRSKRIADWKAGSMPVDAEQLLSMIGTIGKGRLAARLAEKVVGLVPPDYIASAIKHVLKDV